MRIMPYDQPILTAIEKRGTAIVERAVNWCRINSGSRNIAGLCQMAEQLELLLKAFPGETEVIELSPSPVVADSGEIQLEPHGKALRLTIRPQAPVQVVLTGHYDTVYPADSPFQSIKTREDGALNGPGIADMKGGISIMFAALEAFEEHQNKAKVGYRVMLSPDEEIGSPGSASLLVATAKFGQVGLVYEPALSNGTLAAERKGSGGFHIRVRGKAAHAGRDFASGRNAIIGAAGIARALHDLNGKYEGVTINVSAISGGSPRNIVPDNAVVRLNVRVPTRAASEWVLGEIERIVADKSLTEHYGLTVSLHGSLTHPPKPMDASQHAFFLAVKEAGGLLGQSIQWKPSGGTCEGNILHAAGLPNIDTLGVLGGDLHSENEYAWSQSFVERAQLSALILTKLASGEIDASHLKKLRDEA